MASWAQGALRQVIMEHVRKLRARWRIRICRERGADVEDLGQRVLAYLQDLRQPQVSLPRHTILVGEEVTAAMLAEIPQEQLKGIVSARGSGSSHVAILARALDIPCVMGALDLPLAALDGQTADRRRLPRRGVRQPVDAAASTLPAR